ncbi:hypothetical protein T492DRAFT_878844 [Pavlovales sp. CCMP2436]|nr:hypothetical protein T492DRAFT_878844 [Pavlovales sp. CCMP2436]
MSFACSALVGTRANEIRPIASAPVRARHGMEPASRWLAPGSTREEARSLLFAAPAGTGAARTRARPRQRTVYTSSAACALFLGGACTLALAGWCAAAAADPATWARGPSELLHWLLSSPQRGPPPVLAIVSSASLLCSTLPLLLLLGRSLAQAEARRRCGTSELERASWLSWLTFWWATTSLRAAAKHGKLSMAELPRLSRADQPARLFRRFAQLRARGRGGAVRLLARVLFWTQRRAFLASFCCGWLFLLSMLLDPPLLQSEELVVVLLLSLNMLLRVSCMELCWFNSVRVAANARATLVVALFRAALLPGEAGISSGGQGQLTNLMATDADKLGKYF